jgi:hypothetical protein
MYADDGWRHPRGTHSSHLTVDVFFVTFPDIYISRKSYVSIYLWFILVHLMAKPDKKGFKGTV